MADNGETPRRCASRARRDRRVPLGSGSARTVGAVLGAVAPTLSGAGFAMVNLPPEALDALAAAGVDAVTLANNHGMDYGESGLADSLAIRATSEESPGVVVVGIGSDAADAYSPLVSDVSGQRLGVIAATDVLDGSLQAAWTADGTAGLASAKPEQGQARLLEAVGAARPEVDMLVVYLHMGVEKHTCPTPRHQELTRMLHEAGADVVIGSHAHRLQGAGHAPSGFVADGLGNYVFKAPSPPGRKSGTIQNLVPVPLQAGAAEAGAAEEFDTQRGCAGLDATPSP